MKTDGRVRYTKMVIRESLLKLLAKKNIQKITVKEICDLAEINRATFYTHYQDAFDLLEQIENEIFEELSSLLTQETDPSRITEEIFMITKKNIDLCRVLFSENVDRMFLRRIMEVAREKAISGWQHHYPQATTQQLDFLYTYLTSGSTAVIEQWVRTGMQEPPPALGNISKKVTDIWLRTLLSPSAS